MNVEKKEIKLLKDYAKTALTRDDRGMLLMALMEDEKPNVQKIMAEIRQDSSGNFLAEVIKRRFEVLGMEADDSVIFFALGCLGITTPGQSSLLVHSVFMTYRADCLNALETNSKFVLNVGMLVEDIFPDGFVSGEDWDMLWDHQRQRGVGNLVDDLTGYYYGY